MTPAPDEWLAAEIAALNYARDAGEIGEEEYAAFLVDLHSDHAVMVADEAERRAQLARWTGPPEP